MFKQTSLLVLAASLATGCMLNGKSFAAGSTTMPTAPTPVESAPVPMGGGSSDAATSVDDAPSVTKYKFELKRAEAGRNEQTQKLCLEAYEAVIAAGISPDAIIWFNNEQHAIGKLKDKHCIGALADEQRKQEERAAPYRAHLKADKLAMASSSHYAIAGGDYSMVPAKLAKATVWFDSVGAPSNEAQTCPNGAKRNILRRYTFDGAHKLVSRTQKEHCGDIPASAYR